MADYQSLLDQCHKPFKWYQHEFLQNKFIYVRIQDTVLRLNSLGVPWHFMQGDVVIEENPKKTSNGSTQFDAITIGQLEIEGLGTRGAPGASTSTDKDNASKAAHSFALRKASSLFGISHYLMVNPAQESAFVKFMANADLDDLPTLKRAIKMICDIHENIDSPRELLAQHGLQEDQYSDPEFLRLVLAKEGRI